MRVRFFDAFSGIGGFRIGFEREGFECVGWSEIDETAIKFYKAFFEDEQNYGDIREIDPRKLPDFEVLTAGVPCQPFSIAGERKGLKEDPRGMPLWRAVFRILEIKRPRVVLLENVRGLLSSNRGRDFAWVLFQLAKLGYSIEWQVLNSKAFGVPQNRERVFVVGYSGVRRGAQIFPIRESEKAYFTPPVKRRQVQELPGEPYILQWRRSYLRTFKNPLIFPTLTASMGEGGLTMPLIAFITRFPPSETDILIRKITPLEAFRVQGFPDEAFYTAKKVKISDTEIYRLTGNAVSVPVVQSIARKIRKTFFS